ncbi:hypothetical protein [Nocardia higoensis]|uniref:hypothetical protein n=1 Tax=Nocardia higoensis TaxID=228599 RepID=UPI0002DB329A|nr:hypothetical protein [Nocardia higoensis]
MSTAVEPSAWQQRIAGEWVGRPSLFDAHGVWHGFEDIRRSSVFDNGVTTYYMDGGIQGSGALANRFALAAPFAFGVIDSDADRLYTGPDFFGSGQPYGGFVDARYYGPGWQVGLNTWNQTIGDSQVYSSVLRQGPAMVGVFNGLYTRVPELVEDHLAHETRCGAVAFMLPTKDSSRYGGACELWGADQQKIGAVHIDLDIEPVNLLTAVHTVTWSGAMEQCYRTTARRDGARLFYEGPDGWGNATSYGRANYPTVHFADGKRIEGREFMMDAQPGMGAGTRLAVVYELFEHNRLASVVHGVLERS